MGWLELIGTPSDGIDPIVPGFVVYYFNQMFEEIKSCISIPTCKIENGHLICLKPKEGKQVS